MREPAGAVWGTEMVEVVLFPETEIEPLTEPLTEPEMESETEPETLAEAAGVGALLGGIVAGGTVIVAIFRRIEGVRGEERGLGGNFEKSWVQRRAWRDRDGNTAT